MSRIDWQRINHNCHRAQFGEGLSVSITRSPQWRKWKLPWRVEIFGSAQPEEFPENGLDEAKEFAEEETFRRLHRLAVDWNIGNAVDDAEIRSDERAKVWLEAAKMARRMLSVGMVRLPGEGLARTFERAAIES